MLKLADLKHWLHEDLSRTDKLLLGLASLEHPCSVNELKERCLEAGFRETQKWNVSQILLASKGAAIRIPAGWEITEKGRQRIRDLGIGAPKPAPKQAAVDLRAHLAKVRTPETAAFVEEAITCYENGLFRSAIVMSWLAAMHVLYLEVTANHLAAFNAEALKVDAKWRPAANPNGLARMKEHDFLERLPAISVVGKNVKEELQKALKLRNGCGHPNSLRVSANMAASHIEVLLLNVFDRFAH